LKGSGRPPQGSKALFDLDGSVFVLNVPFSLDTKVANNATMEKLGRQGRQVDRARAGDQWEVLYRHLAARSLVYLLPSRAGLQDQPFVANLGVALVHLADPVFVLSRFRAKAREGEPAAGRIFLRGMGIRTASCPAFFEGEADLKHLRSNVYIGGHGLRSSPDAHRWLERRFGAEVVPVLLRDPHLYHLDCVLHVLSPDRVLLATDAIARETVRRIERLAQIVDVPSRLAYRGATNIARAGNEILCDSLLPALPRADPRYPVEKEKLAFWQRIASRFALTPVFFDLSEFHKSGAMLSCLVLPLTYPHLRASP
jgi:N-dimethylarginine dimethylaminohydrolase